MTTDGKCVAAFFSTHDAMNSEAVLTTARVPFELIPTPRSITADCSLAIVFDCTDISTVGDIFDRECIEVSGYYRYSDGRYRPIEES